MQSADLQRSLPALFNELVHGAAEHGGVMLNGGDRGLLASLDRLTAEQASAVSGASSIAAHVRHLDFGLSLMNRWGGGEANPFANADWAAAWTPPQVSSEEWQALRASLAANCETWLAHLKSDRPVEGIELNGVIGSIAHLAYHLGAIRQMHPLAKGPSAND